MNSIEVTSSPEVTPISQKESQKEAASMRLFYKDPHDKAYTLHKEGTDFQGLMKEAVKLQDKGRDILLNEKDNPNIVHAKSNKDKDVDVGRVIEPAKASDGTYKKGVGEVVLASFFEKLPLDTKTFDAQQPAQPPVKAAVTLEKDQTVKSTPDQPTPPKEALKAQAGADVQTEEAKPSKVNLKKDGYPLPEAILKTYHVKDGQFKERGTDALRFEDHGKKLSTPVEDRQVIADMIAVAAAKNWGTLELKGTDNFKQLAWLEAQARGMDTKGYKPNERDLEQLEHLKRERGINTNGPAIAGAGDKAVGNTVEVVVARERTNDPAEKKEPATAVQASAAVKSEAKVTPEPVTADKSDVLRVETGRLIEHGPAKYKFDPDEKGSYYAKLETEKGEKVVWSKDLERAISDAHIKPGDMISLSLKGTKDVEVKANIRDDAGKVVGTETIEAQRNKWEAKPVDLGVTRTLSKDEQLRVDAATKVLGKAIAKMPEAEREKILAKVGEAINKGEIQLPTPKVTVRSSVEKPTPSPSRDRAQEQVRSR